MGVECCAVENSPGCMEPICSLVRHTFSMFHIFFKVLNNTIYFIVINSIDYGMHIFALYMYAVFDWSDFQDSKHHAHT